MKLVKWIGASALAVCLATSASALGLPVTFTAVDDTFKLRWTDLIRGETLEANADLTLTSNSAMSGAGNRRWEFAFVITNSSTHNAAITSWGFDTTPNRISGTFGVSGPTGWVPKENTGGVVEVENCATTNAGGPNCNGAKPADGIASGANPQPVTFNFGFDLASDQTSVTFDKFLTRWQAVGSDPNNETSTVLNVIPLPASSLLLLSMMGAGGIAAWRKRRQAA